MKMTQTILAPLRWLFFFFYVSLLAAGVIIVREKLPLSRETFPAGDISTQYLYEFSADHDLEFQGSFQAAQVQVYSFYRILENPQPGEHRHNLEGFAFESSSRTPAGPFSLLLFVDPAGTLLDVRTVKHSEWLGMDQLFRHDSMIFNALKGQLLESLRSMEMPRVLGAVQISEAIENAVVDGLEFFEEHKELLMQLHPFANEPAEMPAEEKEKSFFRQIIDTVNPLEGLQIHESEFQDV